MTDLFDVNGNATKTHTVTVSGFEPGTGEHIATYDVRIFVGTGIPGFSTMVLSPPANDGYAVCWNGTSWDQVEDLRGKTAFKKSDRTPEIIRSLGLLDDAYTLLAPATQYDKWNGSGWVTDTDAQHDADVATAEQVKQNLLTSARSTISIWQTELQLGTISEVDKNLLVAWLAYIKNVQSVDIASPLNISWPAQPVA